MERTLLSLLYDGDFSNDPIHYNEHSKGWVFWNETWESVSRPFKTEWECEKMLSLYILDIAGCGENHLLYIDRTKAINNAKILV